VITPLYPSKDDEHNISTPPKSYSLSINGLVPSKMIQAVQSTHVSTRGPISQDENRNQIRRMIRNKLLKLLQTKFPQAHQDTRLGAKVLEEMLYRSTSSFYEYQDLSTLESRIRIVVMVKLQRRMQTKNSKAFRTKVLQRCLQSNYLKASELVRAIQLAKNEKVSTMKCTGGTCSLPFRENFPLVVRNLFFDTALIDAFDKTPVERIPSLDWNGLIDIAEKNFKAYHESSFRV
jgi:hypothetical protein